MPTDHRRLPVPDESQSPHAIAKCNQTARKLQLDSNGCRQDGRKPGDIRPIFLRAGVVSQAKGSAYMEMNQTKIICAVYGPREVTRREDFSMQGQLNCELKYAPFSCSVRRGHQVEPDERDASSILTQALSPAVCLEKFPKARMDIFVTVLQDDGGALGGAISCASVALADAGIEMYDLVVGASLRQWDALPLLDPVSPEESRTLLSTSGGSEGNITLGFMPSLNQVAALVQAGEMECHVAIEGIKLLTEACMQTLPILQQCLVRAVKERSKEEQKT